jgi:outer membrane autotransporter protein
VRKAGEQLAPQTNFATQQVAITMAFLTGQYIDERLLGVGATAPSGTAFTPPSGLGASNIASNFAPPPYALGMGSGDGRMNAGANDDTFYYDVGGYDPKWNNYGLWGQAFGAGLSQNQIANVDGYNANLYGALIGMDNWVNPALRVGFAGGWGHTGINGTGDTTRNETDIHSYMGFAYGAVKGYGWYMSGRAGFAWHNYDASRVLNAGGLNQVANGSHDGRQYIGALELGTPFGYGMTTITPVVSVNYTHLNQDGYKEQGGGMALTSADQETDSLQSGLGLKAVAKVASSTLIEGRALWFHEFDDAEQQVTAAFAGTPSFTTAGPGVGRDTADLGVGILAYTSTGTSFQINYDALLRQDFTGHTGTAKLKFDF